MIVSETEAGLAVGSQLARGLGVPTRTVSSLASVMRRELDARAAELAAAGADPAADGPSVPIFKFDQTKAPAPSDDPISSDSAMAAGGRPLLQPCRPAGLFGSALAGLAFMVAAQAPAPSAGGCRMACLQGHNRRRPACLAARCEGVPPLLHPLLTPSHKPWHPLLLLSLQSWAV